MSVGSIISSLVESSYCRGPFHFFFVLHGQPRLGTPVHDRRGSSCRLWLSAMQGDEGVPQEQRGQASTQLSTIACDSPEAEQRSPTLNPTLPSCIHTHSRLQLVRRRAHAEPRERPPPHAQAPSPTRAAQSAAAFCSSAMRAHHFSSRSSTKYWLEKLVGAKVHGSARTRPAPLSKPTRRPQEAALGPLLTNTRRTRASWSAGAPAPDTQRSTRHASRHATAGQRGRLLSHSNGCRAPGRTDVAGAVGVAAAQRVRAAQRHDLLVVEALAPRPRSACQRMERKCAVRAPRTCPAPALLNAAGDHGALM